MPLTISGKMPRALTFKLQPVRLSYQESYKDLLEDLLYVSYLNAPFEGSRTNKNSLNHIRSNGLLSLNTSHTIICHRLVIHISKNF